LGAPHGRPLTPATNASVPIRHRLADFFRGLSGTPVVAIRQRGGMILIEGRVDNRAFQGQVVGGSRPDDWPRPLGLEDVAPAPADATVASTAETAAPTSGPRVVPAWLPRSPPRGRDGSGRRLPEPIANQGMGPCRQTTGVRRSVGSCASASAFDGGREW